jgi:hypothetical protein
MIHNRHLPNWAHRVANAVLGLLGCASAGAAGFAFFREGSVQEQVAGWLLWLSPVAGVLLAALNPRRISLVEGLAGDAGYDELEDRRRP